jgi:ParB/RepB/Spo0J family partition protein
MPATMKRFPKVKAALAAKVEPNGELPAAHVPILRLKSLPSVRGALSGAVHISGLGTVGDVLALGPDRHHVFSELMRRGLNTQQADVLMGDIETAWRKSGSAGEPWGAKPQAAPPAEAPTPPAPAPELQVPPANVDPSSLNPRKTFDQVALQELADSITKVGILQPLVVRPTYRLPRGGHVEEEAYWSGSPLGKGEIDGVKGPAAWPNMQFELVAGERRYRAAKLAGLQTVPVKVYRLTDAEALEIMIVENLQRADVAPLEEADGYFQLLQLGKTTVDAIAAKIGKSTGYIYQRLKLRGLPDVARNALEAGEIPATVAALIARIPGDKLKAEAAKRILKGQEHWDAPGGGWHRVERGPMNLRDARSFVEAVYMRELKGAPFDRTALDLVPSVGACTACPKMTGNNREEFPDARGDVCTDPACYAKKVDAHNRLRLAEYAAKPGYTVLTGKKADDFPSYNHHRLGERCYEDRKGRTYKTLLKDAVASGKAKVTVLVNRRGEIEEFIPRQQASTLIRGKADRSHARRSHGPSPHSAAAKKDRELEELYDALKVELMDRVFSVASCAVMKVNEEKEKIARLVLGRLILDRWEYDEVARLAINRRQPDKSEPKSMMGGGHGDALQKLVDEVTVGGLVGLLAELQAADAAPSRFDHGRKQHAEDAAFWKALRIDPAKVLEEVKRRREVEKAQANGKQPAQEPDPGRGKSARAKRRKLHPEEEVPEPAVAGDDEE